MISYEKVHRLPGMRLKPRKASNNVDHMNKVNASFKTYIIPVLHLSLEYSYPTQVLYIFDIEFGKFILQTCELS